MTFRINRKKVGLTYSCPVNLEENPIGSKLDLLTFLKTFGDIDKYLICSEEHKTGKTHYHAYVVYVEKLDIKNPNAFDCEGVHPNIIKPGNGWINYCAKEGEIITDFYEKEPVQQSLELDTWEEARGFLLKKIPMKMIQYLPSIQKNWRTLKQAQTPVEPRPERTFLIEYKDTRLPLVFIGKSNMGKTQFALSHFKNPLLVRHLDKLKKLTPEHDGIVFDDMSFLHCPRQTHIYLLDIEEESELNVRYGTVIIPKGMPRIFTCNHGFFPFIEDDEAIDRRLLKYTFDTMLYKK